MDPVQDPDFVVDVAASLSVASILADRCAHGNSWFGLDLREGLYCS